MQIKCAVEGNLPVVTEDAEPEPSNEPVGEPAVENPQPGTDISQNEFVVKEDANGNPFVAEIDQSEPVEEQVPASFIGKVMNWLRNVFRR